MRYVIVPTLLLAFLAFACDDNGDGTTPTATSTAEPLTTIATTTPEPAVETLAFIRDGDIWLIDPDGGNEERITQYADSDSEVVSFTWLADGQNIAYQVAPRTGPGSPTPLTAINVLADADGTVLWERELARTPGPGNAVWSPNGELVAVREETAVTVENVDGRTAWTGTVQEQPEGSYPSFSGVAWSPDGRRLAYVDGEEIVAVDLSGDPPAEQRAGMFSTPCPPGEKCPSTRAVFGGIAFARDGMSLVVPVASEGEIGAVGNANFVVYKVDLAAPTPTRSLFFPPRGEDQKEFSSLPDPEFSPDGRYVAYPTFVHLSACEGFSAVTVLSVDGSQVERFVPDEITSAQDSFTPQVPDSSRGPGIYHSGFAWSPAGDAIVTAFQMVDCSLAGQPGISREDIVLIEGIYIARVDGFAEEKLVDEYPLSVPAWSPSSELIAYVAGDSEEDSHIRAFDLVSREIIDLGSGTQPAWQPQQ